MSQARTRFTAKMMGRSVIRGSHRTLAGNDVLLSPARATLSLCPGAPVRGRREGGGTAPGQPHQDGPRATLRAYAAVPQPLPQPLPCLEPGAQVRLEAFSFSGIPWGEAAVPGSALLLHWGFTSFVIWSLTLPLKSGIPLG